MKTSTAIIILLAISILPTSRASSAPTCNATDIAKCINVTSATPSTFNESQEIRTCLDLAKGTRAFVCRCTLKIFQCLVKQNCSYSQLSSTSSKSATSVVSANKNASSEDICKAYVRKQDFDCSETLCRYFPGGALGVSVPVGFFLTTFIMLISFV